MNYAVRTNRANTEKYVESAARGMPDCKITNYETVLATTDFDKVVFMGTWNEDSETHGFLMNMI